VHALQAHFALRRGHPLRPVGGALAQVLLQVLAIVAEVLGIDPFDIRVVTADTDLTPVDLGSYSSPARNLLIAAHERAG